MRIPFLPEPLYFMHLYKCFAEWSDIYITWYVLFICLQMFDQSTEPKGTAKYDDLQGSLA